MTTNGWMPEVILLRLQEALEEDSENCGQGANAQPVVTVLRVSFGMSSREAWSKLSVLKREY